MHLNPKHCALTFGSGTYYNVNKINLKCIKTFIFHFLYTSFKAHTLKRWFPIYFPQIPPFLTSNPTYPPNPSLLPPSSQNAFNLYLFVKVIK